MCRSHGHHPIFCILPPHILLEIAKRGTPQQREAAVDALSLDHSLRSTRLALSLAGDLKAPRTAVTGTPQKQRTIYTANQTQTLPGQLLRAEGQGPSTDLAANQAYDGLGATFDFYLNIYQRNSIDNAGLPLKATVHYDRQYDNAFWNGQQMVFGDGDGTLFNGFTSSLDVIGHELTHGVTGSEANLTYQDQPGALNESISDVFGSLVKQYSLKQTAAAADWLIGAELLAKGVKGVALRSMKAPGTAYDDPTLGKDPQPANMAHYVHTAEDSGGVHINSGIPNHAFFLLATALAGHAWEKAGLIWYNTLNDPTLKPTASFSAFASLTVINAGHLYGTSSAESNAVRDAWRQVGVPTSAHKTAAAGK